MNLQFENFSLDFILLFSSALLVLSVLASRISSSFGVPALLLFLGMGMLAGSEGPGNIPFENYPLAYSVGSVCLAFIIFDGGVRTSLSSIQPILKMGVSLSFLGTLITAIVTGLFAHYSLGLGWVGSFLLGAIVSSTDAAAVFSILRSKGLSLKGNLKQTLEFEAGSNDPVAVLLTVIAVSFATSTGLGAGDTFLLLLKQIGFGLVAGWYGARLIRIIVNLSGLEFEGLYGVLVVGLSLIIFSTTSYIGGSGFLAVYVAGLMLGSSEFLHKATVVRFLDGIAWLCQIVIFLVLGLLVFPSNLLGVWKEGLLISFFMMLVARPISVFLSTPGKALTNRERFFVSWVGLRGAAPIILATLPWSLGLPDAEYYFNLVFFIVLTSVVFQGISIPWFAELLKVTSPLLKNEPHTRSSTLLPPGFISIEIKVIPKSMAEGKRIVDLKIPSGTLLTSLERKERYLVPQGDTVIEENDTIWGLARLSNLSDLEKIFGSVKRQ